MLESNEAVSCPVGSVRLGMWGVLSTGSVTLREKALFTAAQLQPFQGAVSDRSRQPPGRTGVEWREGKAPGPVFGKSFPVLEACTEKNELLSLLTLLLPGRGGGWVVVVVGESSGSPVVWVTVSETRGRTWAGDSGLVVVSELLPSLCSLRQGLAGLNEGRTWDGQGFPWLARAGSTEEGRSIHPISRGFPSSCTRRAWE